MKLKRLLTICSAIVAGALPGSAADNLSDGDLKIQGVFDSNLPGTERKHSLRFIFRPHVGDLHRYDYMRVPIGLRYGSSARLELSGEIEGYLAHGLGDAGWFSEAGFSEAHFGAKYRLNHGLYGWESAVGLDYRTPLGRPPPQITDGFSHLVSYVTFSRRLESLPNLRLFWSLGSDLISDKGIPRRVRKNQFYDDSINASGGFVWERGAFNYTFEAGYGTTRILGGEAADIFSLKPGVLWAVPRRLTARIGGQWVLGFGLHSSFGPDGTDVGGTLKARVSIDFKRWLRRRHTKP